MKNRDFYYIDYLGTQLEARGQGFGSGFMRYAQQVAAEAGKPIYLQSSTETNRRLYEKHGFKLVKEQVLGKGLVGSNGTDTSGEKKGVVWWALTWEPDHLPAR